MFVTLRTYSDIRFSAGRDYFNGATILKRGAPFRYQRINARVYSSHGREYPPDRSREVSLISHYITRIKATTAFYNRDY